jgi:hypothetical protein
MGSPDIRARITLRELLLVALCDLVVAFLLLVDNPDSTKISG